MDHRLVAIAAALLSNCAIAGLDLDWLVEDAGREGGRVPEPVRGFRDILGDRAFGRVTVVAGSSFAVASCQPGGVLWLHDVAIGARTRVIGQI